MQEECIPAIGELASVAFSLNSEPVSTQLSELAELVQFDHLVQLDKF